MGSDGPLRIRLERPPPDDIDPATGRPAQPFDLGPAGEPVFRPEETADRKLGTLVRRIWEEKGGIQLYTSAGLAAALAKQEAGGTAAQVDDENDDVTLAAQLAEPMDGQEEEDGAERAVGPTLDLDGMRAFKTEIWEQLEQSKHALSNFHHALTLLLPPTLTGGADGSTKEPANPQHALPPHIPLPPSSLSTTLVASKPHEATDEVRSALLAKKQADLRRTASQLGREGQALEAVVRKNADEWRIALEVKRSGWPMALRNVQAGIGAEGSLLGGKRDERDWAAWYALENAPVALRLRHTAHLPPPSSDPSTSLRSDTSAASGSSLSFPARTRKRLRLTIERTLPDGAIERKRLRSAARSGATRPDGGASPTDVEGALEEAMREAVDEEIFAEVMAEARQSPMMRPSRMTATSVLLDVSPKVALVVSFLPDLPPSTSGDDDDDDDDDSDIQKAGDPLATLLLSRLRTQLLALHTYRLQALHSSLLPLRDPSRPATPRPKFLGPVVEQLQFVAVERAVNDVVGALREGVRAWGGELDVRWEETSAAPAADAAAAAAATTTDVERRSKTCIIAFGRSFTAASHPSASRLPTGRAQAVRLHLLGPARIFAVLAPPAETGVSAPAGPRAPIPIADLAHLSSLLARVLQACLVRNVVDLVGGLNRALPPSPTTTTAAAMGADAAGRPKQDVPAGPKRTTCCFPDDGKGLAVLQWTRGQILARPAIVLAPESDPKSSRPGRPTLSLQLAIQRPRVPAGASVVDPPAYTSGPGANSESAADWLLAHWRRLAG